MGLQRLLTAFAVYEQAGDPTAAAIPTEVDAALVKPNFEAAAVADRI